MSPETFRKSATFILAAALLSINSAARADADPCASLTPATIQTAIDAIGQSRAQAESDVAVNGVTGAYASAARDNLSYLREAEGQMTYLLSWLAENQYTVPYSSSNAAYNIHGYARQTIIPLLYAEHWATISAVYHTSLYARRSFDLTAAAINLVNAVGRDSGACYMQGYGL